MCLHSVFVARLSNFPSDDSEPGILVGGRTDLTSLTESDQAVP